MATDDDSAAELKAARRALYKHADWVLGQRTEPTHVTLRQMAAWCEERGYEPDNYGEGEDLQAFERRVGELLGYPAARFMPSGTMAQSIAMRIWSERAGCSVFGMHPTSHLELHEQHAYNRLHGLSRVLVGPAERPILPSDLSGVAEPLSALLIELPTRENGGQLAPWDQLVALCESARDQGIKTHLDGARLWEAAAGYERPFTDICALFDSAYVSFYKGIGALAGCMLLGPADFIEEAEVWQRRQGGNLFTQLPNWASAAVRLDTQLDKFAEYRARAVEVADAFSKLDGVRINPDPPHTSLFHVWLEGTKEGLELARDRLVEESGLWLFGGLDETEAPGFCKFELNVGDAALEVDLESATDALRRVLALATDAANPALGTNASV